MYVDITKVILILELRGNINDESLGRDVSRVYRLLGSSKKFTTLNSVYEKVKAQSDSDVNHSLQVSSGSRMQKTEEPRDTCTSAYVFLY